MRAAVYYSNQDLRIQEYPQPKICPGEILVRVEAAGICGSDVMEWYRINRVPLILGHEISGVIAEVGPGVRKYCKGQRVSAAHHIPCGKCAYCLNGHATVCQTLRKTNFDPGGFAEFLRLTALHVEKGLFLLPDNVSYEEGTFVEPLACVLRAQKQVGDIKGKRVLLLGCGIAGILHIHLAKFSGALFIAATDIQEWRLKQAKTFGADITLEARQYSPEEARKINQGRLFDLVIVATGNPAAIQQACDSVERDGTILFFAPTEKDAQITFPFNQLFWRTQLTLTSSYAGSPADYQEALDLIATHKLNLTKMITHCFPLTEISQGFKLVAEARDSLKVVIYPQKPIRTVSSKPLDA